LLAGPIDVEAWGSSATLIGWRGIPLDDVRCRKPAWADSTAKSPGVQHCLMLSSYAILALAPLSSRAASGHQSANGAHRELADDDRAAVLRRIRHATMRRVF